MAKDQNGEAASLRDAPRDDSSSSVRLTKSSTSPSTRSSLSHGHRRRPSQQPPETPPDAASKTSARSSETSGSAESESRASRRQQAASFLSPKNASRRSTSPAGRFKGIFRSKKSHSNLRNEANPERSQPDPVPERHPDPVSQPQADTSPKIESPSREPSAAKPPSRAARLPQPKLDTSVRPRTPPRSESGPTIVSTPPTPTYQTSTRPGISGPRHTAGTESPPSEAKSDSAASSPPPNVLSAHRRLQSGTAGGAGPSKLANTTLPPPTPEASSPGPSGTAGSPAASSGFFSSVFSAAQNAANTFSSSIQPLAPSGTKATRTGQPEVSTQPPGAPDEGVEVQALAREMPEDQITDTKEPAINTLGSGDLSLSQLGLSDPSLESSGRDPARSPSPRGTMERRTRSESTPAVPSPSLSHAPYSSTFADEFSTSKSRSLNEHSSGGEKTPPTVSLLDEKPVRPGVNRSGSVRSAIGRHRKRGSSAATGYTTTTDKTGTTIGAAIVAANASFAHPRAGQGAPKLTGFAIASKRRNRDFHNQFKSVPDDDYLIEDYSCALQREILAHGRLYVSEGHLCFSSNILGWMTTLVLSFDEIVSVEKRSTAMLFKNGLMISTLHNRHVFASFTNRDATYDLVIKIWQLGHPKLQSTLNGIRLEGPGGDKTERIEDDDAAMDGDGDDQSLSGSEDDSEDDIYDEDDESVDMMDASQLTDGSADGDAERIVARKASGGAVVNGASVEAPGKEDAANGAPSTDFPGPTSHPPTDCGDAANHFDKITGDDVIPAPMGQVFSLLFGAQSPAWIAKFLADNQKCTELQMEDMRALGGDNMSRTYSYTKPLPGGIGPKQTRCIINETIENLDFERAVNLVLITQTPDVPSGNVFCVKTRYCLSWAEKDRTRVQVNCGIEWSGKSWIKGPIENGAREGQSGYTKDLFACLRTTLEARPGAAAPKRKKGRKARTQQATAAAAAEAPKAAPKRDWGLLEPARSVLEPLLDIVSPILTGNVVYGLLVGLLVAAWFGFGLNGGRRYDERVLGPYGYPERVAAYEEMWRREESELWEWLEERVGMHRLGNEGVRTVVEPRVMGEKVGAVGGGREVEEAIKVTEEKLRVLKEVVEKG